MQSNYYREVDDKWPSRLRPPLSVLLAGYLVCVVIGKLERGINQGRCKKSESSGILFMIGLFELFTYLWM